MKDAGGPVAWLVVPAVGIGVGMILAAAVRRLHMATAGRPEPRVAAVGRRVVMIAPIAAVGLWWWEVMCGGLLATGAVEPPAVGVARYGGHVVFFALLAAAAWIDFEHRVIPDAITVPGVIAGLVWSTFEPAALLPIVVDLPRDFAQPLSVPDVLGLAGGLRDGVVPSWLGPRPAVTGLAAALAVVLGWGTCCTAPFFEAGVRCCGAARLLPEPRGLALAVATLTTAAAWYVGGAAWSGLLSSLAGLAAGAAMIWLTRLGASRALGREAMGFGDVTLMAMIGAWLGWQPCVLVCCLAVFIGLVHGGLQFVLHREAELPFGPSLCLAATVVVVCWRAVWERVGVYFSHPLDMAAVVTAVIVLTAATLFVWSRMRAHPHRTQR